MNTNTIAKALAKFAVPVDSLKFDGHNARKHDEKNLAAIEASLLQFGQVRPILVMPDNTVIAGNGTLSAAKRLGWTKVAVVVFEGTEEQARAYAIADNRTAELATWDIPELASQLESMPTFDLGFTPKDIKAIVWEAKKEADAAGLAEAPLILPKKASTHPGDIYALGKHRLICGDSGEEETYTRLMPGETATLVFTDPPYGVSIGKKNVMLNSFQKAGRNLTSLAADDMPAAELKAVLLNIFKVSKKLMADDCSVFVCSPQGGELGMMMMMMMMQEAGLTVRHIVNWAKNGPTFSMGRLDYDYQHEPILFTWVKTHKRNKLGPFQTSLWPVDKPTASKEHPTMKPVELPVNAILNHTDEGDIVLDMFGGSGTTLIAAEKTGRACRMVEISPIYCDVIRTRWANLTGGKPELVTGPRKGLGFK